MSAPQTSNPSTWSVPTDPSYYLASTGLGSLVPGAFNANTLEAMFAPQGMMHTPVNNMATNPFLQMFLQQAGNIGTPRPQLKPGIDDQIAQQAAQQGAQGS